MSLRGPVDLGLAVVIAQLGGRVGRRVLLGLFAPTVSHSRSSERSPAPRGRVCATAAAWSDTPSRTAEARRTASCLLAFCDMRTLYLRNVPDDVVERLERLAARDATSVGAVAVRELAEVSRRADNPALLGALPDLGVDVTTILKDMDAGRAER